jgi:hypothetical protein
MLTWVQSFAKTATRRSNILKVKRLQNFMLKDITVLTANQLRSKNNYKRSMPLITGHAFLLFDRLMFFNDS